MRPAGPPWSLDRMVSLFLNLLDLSDDILVLIHQTDYSYRPKIGQEFFIVSQKLLRGKQRRGMF